MAILDTGASINLISREAADKIRGDRVRIEKTVKTVGSELKLDEAVVLNIKIGKTRAEILAYIVDRLPADILLGTPFLEKYSRGFNRMSAAPLGVIKVRGAKIFTMLDCKNAFYSLELAKRDREFTAISPPGMARLELTRMPMGAKASTAA